MVSTFVATAYMANLFNSPPQDGGSTEFTVSIPACDGLMS